MAPPTSPSDPSRSPVGKSPIGHYNRLDHLKALASGVLARNPIGRGILQGLARLTGSASGAEAWSSIPAAARSGSIGFGGPVGALRDDLSFMSKRGIAHVRGTRGLFELERSADMVLTIVAGAAAGRPFTPEEFIRGVQEQGHDEKRIPFLRAMVQADLALTAQFGHQRIATNPSGSFRARQMSNVHAMARWAQAQLVELGQPLR